MAIDRTKTFAAAITQMALPVLVSRAGGEITFTKAEFDQVTAMYGGNAEMVLRCEELTGGGITSRTFRIRLARKKAGPGELPM